MSCGAACARQLLLDAGIDVPEETLRERAGFHPELGITLDALAVRSTTCTRVRGTSQGPSGPRTFPV